MVTYTQTHAYTHTHTHTHIETCVILERPVYNVIVLECGGGASAVTMKSATFITPGIKLNRFILFARKVDLLAFSG